MILYFLESDAICKATHQMNCIENTALYVPSLYQ